LNLKRDSFTAEMCLEAGTFIHGSMGGIAGEKLAALQAYSCQYVLMLRLEEICLTLERESWDGKKKGK